MLDDKDKMHEVVFSDTTLKLGEIHWTLLKSAELMDGKQWKVEKGPIGSTRGLTKFGKEVGGDEIHWWIFEKETDVDELFTRTKNTLESAQTLKDAASKLKSKEPESYEGLLVTLKDFAEQHRVEIDSLHDYVGWLMKRDMMAPRILFTYRVWGSTRRGDRQLNVKDEENASSNIGKLRTLTEIVLGIRNGGILVYNRAHMEIGFFIFDSLDPEDDAEIVVPESAVIRRTAYAVYENCVTYFTQIRDSLRNILIDIEKYKEQRALFDSDEFWREFITKARNAKTSESQLWDFKETLTIWHINNESERRKAKKKFAEDVASFGNTSGGVLVVGVNDRREVVGIGVGRELENRLKVAADVIAQHIEYDREIVSLRQVAVGERDQEKICLIIVVSQASGAVAVSDGEGNYSYPVRRETGISRVSRDNVPVRSLHLKSDNRDFMHQLRQFIKEN
ncbi:MAG TPA: ATP-binding protein [Pyrinomonadaceae bacterium]|nr:ATP-binding protein [Pyrinomonadaceae bacterium]